MEVEFLVASASFYFMVSNESEVKRNVGGDVAFVPSIGKSKNMEIVSSVILANYRCRC